MKFCRLSEQQLTSVRTIRGAPETVYLRDQVLRFALSELDAALRKAPIEKVQLLQGYAQALSDLIDLLTPESNLSTAWHRNSAER
jgi:hypothetical protein